MSRPELTYNLRERPRGVYPYYAEEWQQYFKEGRHLLEGQQVPPQPVQAAPEVPAPLAPDPAPPSPTPASSAPPARRALPPPTGDSARDRAVRKMNELRQSMR